MADHLPLPVGRPLSSRRRPPVPSERPPVARPAHAAQLRDQLEQAAPVAGESDVDIAELDARVVLKIKGTSRLNVGPFRGLKLTALGEGQGWTYAVLSTRESRSLLADILAEYGESDATEQIDWEHPQTWAALLDTIEDISLYGREDRYDRELDQLTFDDVELVDVVLWPSDTETAANERIAGIVEVIETANARNRSVRVVAMDPRPQTTVVRVAADRHLLDELLDEPWAERVRPPLRPHVTIADLLNAPASVPTEQPSGAAIGVIDGIAVTANPLLTSTVVDSKEFPSGHVFGSPDEHGTKVAAAAAWGDLDFLVRRGMRAPEPHPVVNGRILDLRNGQLTVVGQAHVTIAEAVQWLVANHQVRVVNLSINRGEPADGLLPSELTTTLDELARELDIVIVVSAGNRTSPPEGGWLTKYPHYLIDDEAAVAEPGDAAIAVTVGAIAKRNRPGGHQPRSLIAIAAPGGPSPFTRSGPTRGHTTAGTLKPEFCHHGGNWAHDHQLDALNGQDPGISVVTAIPPRGNRFVGVDNGTSFAAPAVAHEVARIATRYPDASANLLRALLALSARQPLNTQLDGIDLLRTSAYGQPQADRILESGGPVAVLTIEATIQTNSVVIHPVPIPYEFAEGASRRLFRVALAFDPPVRRSRREYLAGTMTVELVRGLDESDVARRYQMQPSLRAAEADPNVHRFDLPDGRRRPNMRPTKSRLASNTLIRRDFDYSPWDPDDEHYFLIVTHNLSPWTPRQKREYGSQRYALAVYLADEQRTNLDLHNLVRAQLRARLRVR